MTGLLERTEPEATSSPRREDLHVRVIRGEMAFTDLIPAWDDLFARATDPSPHLTHAWLSTWFASDRMRGEPTALTVWAGETLVAMLLLQVTRRFGIGFASPIGTGTPSYLGVLIDLERSDAIETLADLVIKRSLSVFLTNDLSSDDSATHSLMAELQRRGFGYRRAERNTCRCIELGCSYHEYLQSTKTGRRRRKLRNEIRQLERVGDIEVQRFSGDEVSPRVLERVALIQKESWLNRRGAATLGDPFHQRLLSQLAHADLARAWIMTIDGEDAAFVLGMEAHRRLQYAWTAFKLKFEKHSVGKILTGRVIQDACEDGMTSMNFGHGDAAYKSFWSTGTHTVDRAIIGRGVVGRMLTVGYALAWRLAESPRLRKLHRLILTALGLN